MARSPCRITRCAIPVRLNDDPGALLYRNLTAHTSPDDHRPHAILCEPTGLSDGESMECHPDTVTGSTVSLLSAADQLALLLFRKHYREGSATGSATAGDNSTSLPETDRSPSRKHQRLPKQDIPGPLSGSED